MFNRLRSQVIHLGKNSNSIKIFFIEVQKYYRQNVPKIRTFHQRTVVEN